MFRLIEKIYKTNIDLFLNKNSLGEMHKDVVKKYLNVITSCARYFFHMNHEKWVHTYEDGSSGLLASDYNIPKKKYKKSSMIGFVLSVRKEETEKCGIQ